MRANSGSFLQIGHGTRRCPSGSKRKGAAPGNAVTLLPGQSLPQCRNGASIRESSSNAVAEINCPRWFSEQAERMASRVRHLTHLNHWLKNRRCRAAFGMGGNRRESELKRFRAGLLKLKVLQTSYRVCRSVGRHGKGRSAPKSDKVNLLTSGAAEKRMEAVAPAF